MPQVIFSDEEKAELNARGADLGADGCPVCGERRNWKQFASVTYQEGYFEVENTNRGRDEAPIFVRGSMAFRPCCEECWQKLDADGKADLVAKLLHQRKSNVKEVIRRPGPSGLLEVCPVDKARHQHESLAEQALHARIVECARGEKGSD